MKRAEHTKPRDKGRQTESAQKTGRLTTVIASMPGIAEQSLKATLEALSSVQIVGTAAGCLSALQLVRDLKAHLVVIDSNLPLEDVQMFLRQLKQEGLPTRSLVLVATDSDVRRALAAGADAALRRDSPSRQLGASVAGFLQRLGGTRAANSEAVASAR